MHNSANTHPLAPNAIELLEARITITSSGISQNTDTHLIGVTEDKLHRILKDHQQRILTSRDWIAPLGVFVSILITLLTSSFQNILFIKAEHWQIIFFTGLCFSLYLTLKSIIISLKKRPMTVNELVKTIAGKTPIRD